MKKEWVKIKPTLYLNLVSDNLVAAFVIIENFVLKFFVYKVLQKLINDYFNCKSVI